MKNYSIQNLNQALILMSQEILNRGVRRQVRGFDCVEIPHPILIEFTNPTDRYVTIPERKWNKYLPFAESLWLALGLNNLDVLPGKYVKNLYNYSDDGHYWRAGYGPRLRAYRGTQGDYKIKYPHLRHIQSGGTGIVDQLKYVIDSLKRDINTRQATIQIGDPVKDSYNEEGELLETKDYPCSRTIQFMMVNGELNCTLYIRSNDVLYGLSAVNVFNFTLMQEYIANILGVPVGKYYHFINNLHVYRDKISKISAFAELDLIKYESEFKKFEYSSRINSLRHFDELCEKLFDYEQHLFINSKIKEPLETGIDMFDDWAKVFYYYQLQKEEYKPFIDFENPYLTKLFEK